MYINVSDHRADPARFKEETAIYYGGIVPVELAIPLFLLVTVPLLWRRVAPIPAVTAALGGLVVNELLVGTDIVRCGVVFPTAFIFAFTTGRQLDGAGGAQGPVGCRSALILLDGVVEFGPFVAVFLARRRCDLGHRPDRAFLSHMAAELESARWSCARRATSGADRGRDGPGANSD